MRSLRLLAFLVLLSPVLLAGCSSSQGPWTELDASALTESEANQFAAATAARDALFNTLMERLVAALQEGGPAAAIGVCKDAAPALAKEVGGARGLTIGRTAYRLRNPRNTPPAWAVPYVGAQRAEPVVLRDESGGALAALFPIQLKSECLQCHGAPEDIQPDVREAIRKAYPRDNATGFKEGELRGWFHVTVPPAV